MIDNFEKKNIIVRLSFVTPIITNYLSLKDFAKCFALSKDIMIIFMDKGNAIFFKYHKLCKACILGPEFIISFAKKRLSPCKKIYKHMCLECCIFYKHNNTLFCISCLKNKLIKK